MADILEDPGIDYPNGHEEPPPPDNWEAIFGAPDWTQLVSPRQSHIAKEYTEKTNSLLKVALAGTLNAKALPDAAAILEYGPPFSKAVGQLADADKRARGIIDLITSPSNPYAMFAMTAIPLIAQLMRNHEEIVSAMPSAIKSRRAQKKADKAAGVPKPKPRFTVKILGRQIGIRFAPRIKLVKLLSGFRSTTSDPNVLVYKIFSDEKLVKALEKEGIHLRAGNSE